MGPEVQNKSTSVLNAKGVISGAAYTTLGRVVSALFGYINLVLAARILSVNDFGLYSYIINLLVIAYIVANMGMENTLLTLLPKRSKSLDREDYRDTLWTAMTYTLATSIVTFLLLILLKPVFSSPFKEADFSLMYYVLIASIPFQAYIVFSRVVNQAGFKFFQSVFPENVLRPVLLFLMLISIFFLGEGYKELVYYSYLLSFFVTFGMALYYMRSSMPRKIQPQFKWDSEVVSLSPHFMSVQLLNQSAPFIITFILGIYVTAENIGFFRASLQTSALIAFTLRSLELVFAPMISSLYTSGDMIKIELYYKKITKWILATGGLISIISLIGSHSILASFGPEFTTAAYALQILAIGQIINAASGSCEYLLMMTGNHKVVVYTTFLQIALVILVGLILIPSTGLLGGVISVTFGLVIFKGSLVLYSWKKLKITPFSFAYTKTITSLFITGVIVYCINLLVHNNNWLLSLVIVASLSTIVFSSIFSLLGLEKEEKFYITKRLTFLIKR